MERSIYIHIPFCRKACRYCDFFFTVSISYKEEFLKALKQELSLRKEEAEGGRVSTIYFGGGTPSVLSIGDLESLSDYIRKNYSLEQDIEFTLEGNPDDLNPGYLSGLAGIGINRLSIGLQSLREEDLILMRRSHTAVQARKVIEDAQLAGFKNMSVDLIYGIPGLGLSDWEKHLDFICGCGVPHLSAYHLTFEPGTVFDHWRKKGRIHPVEEKESFEQFFMLKEKMEGEGFIHYEISNFGKSGFFSKHNLAYWTQFPYQGFGPSAHSYDGKSRRWNISSLKAYLEGVRKKGDNYYETEQLSQKDLYNEYILTSLRTIMGIDLNEIYKRFGDYYVKQTKKSADRFIERKELVREGDKIKLTGSGMFLSDYIIRTFFEL